MRDVELDRRVLGLQSTGEKLCSRQNRRPVQTERSIDPGKTGISGTYAIWKLGLAEFSRCRSPPARQEDEERRDRKKVAELGCEPHGRGCEPA